MRAPWSLLSHSRCGQPVTASSGQRVESSGLPLRWPKPGLSHATQPVSNSTNWATIFFQKYKKIGQDYKKTGQAAIAFPKGRKVSRLVHFVECFFSLALLLLDASSGGDRCIVLEAELLATHPTRPGARFNGLAFVIQMACLGCSKPRERSGQSRSLIRGGSGGAWTAGFSSSC